MRLTSFGVVLVLMTSCLADRTNAQIPERTLFQPGSYAYGMNQGSTSAGMPATETVLVEVPDDSADATSDENNATKTDWEKDFGPNTKQKSTKWVEMQVPVSFQDDDQVMSPYLAYFRHPITHRIHIVPYQKGYPEGSPDFPKHQSQWNLWLSTLPSREQNRPQVKYLGYYDEMPEILENRPTRLQLILGYPDAQWTSSCTNRWGQRLAQCPGVEIHPNGPPAEMCVHCQATLDPAMPQGIYGQNRNAPVRFGSVFRNHSHQQGYVGTMGYAHSTAEPRAFMPQVRESRKACKDSSCRFCGVQKVQRKSKKQLACAPPKCGDFPLKSEDRVDGMMKTEPEAVESEE